MRYLLGLSPLSITRSISTCMAFDGRIVARTVPPAYKDLARGALARTQPDLIFDKKYGPLTHRPKLPLYSEKLEMLEKLSGHEENSEYTTLDIFLYDANDGDSLHMHMNRDADEPIKQTLKRLLITFEKKNITKKDAAECELVVIDANTGEVQRQITDFDIVNQDLWKQSAETPIVLKVHNTESLKTLCFLVESCPPTISSVRTNEDFKGPLFVDVPIVIDYKLLYSDHCCIDWYVDGKCVLRDSDAYRPSIDTVGKMVTVLLTPTRPTHDGRGCEEAFVFTKAVEEKPDSLILNLRGTYWREKASLADPKLLRILTYNILADQNAFGTEGNVAEMYPHASPESLIRERRCPLVLYEILEYKADVICLQEVDEYVFDRLLEPALRFYKYQGILTSKSSIGTREGCAIFWLTETFKVDPDRIKTFTIRDLLPSLNESDWASNVILRELLDRHPHVESVMREKLGHIVQLVPLQRGKETYWIVNTHLFFQPDASHIRLIQSYLLAHQLSRELKDCPGSVIMCGDLNSSLRKGAGKLLVDRLVPANWRDLREDLHNYRWQEDGYYVGNGDKLDDFPELTVGESWPYMSSAFDPEPDFTHIVGENGVCFKGSLDHILISNDLESVSQARMPTLEETPVMPTDTIFSDHVSLVCDIRKRS